MWQLTSEQRVVIVEQHFSNKSPTEVKRAYVNAYNLNINIKTVKRWSAIGEQMTP